MDDDIDWEEADNDWINGPSVGKEDADWEWDGDQDDDFGGEHMEGFGNEEDGDW